MRLEWDNIRRYVKENFSKRNKVRFLENVESKSEKCPFLFGHRCSVYSVRPWACRLCPYIVSFYSHGISSESSRIYLPLCTTLAGAFGVRQGEVTTHEVTALERHKEGNLVRCHFQKPHPLWLIDASDYFKEYDEAMTRADDERLEKRDLFDWIGLSKFMRDEGQISQKKFMQELGLD